MILILENFLNFLGGRHVLWFWRFRETYFALTNIATRHFTSHFSVKEMTIIYCVYVQPGGATVLGGVGDTNREELEGGGGGLFTTPSGYIYILSLIHI